MDGASRGKSGLAEIRGVLHNSKGDVVLMFSKHVSVCDSNEDEVLVILEGLRLFSTRYSGALILESDSSMRLRGYITHGNFNFSSKKLERFQLALMSSSVMRLDPPTQWRMC